MNTDQVIKEIETWFRRREYGRVIYKCEEQLQTATSNPTRAQLLLWKAMAHLQSGAAWYGEAKTCLRDGLRTAGKDRPLKARLMASLAFLYCSVGDLASCGQLMQDFAAISRDRHPAVMRWGVHLWYNYGLTLDNCFHYHEAAEAYRTAISLAREFPVEGLVVTSLHNLGGVLLAMGHIEEAGATIAEAEALIPDEGLQAAKKLNRRAEFALATNDLVSAQQWVTCALIHPDSDDQTKADIFFTWAQTLRALGRSGEAREKALAGLNYAVKAAHYACIHKINVFLQQLGSPEQMA